MLRISAEAPLCSSAFRARRTQATMPGSGAVNAQVACLSVV